MYRPIPSTTLLWSAHLAGLHSEIHLICFDIFF
jgi:hypothetical protein